MISPDYEWIICDEEDCEARIKNRRWGKTKAAWFQSKDGKDFCEDHLPSWVQEWRERKGFKQND